MRTNTYYVATKEVADLTTGEIARVEQVKKQKVSFDSEPFYMVFIDYMAPLFNLKNGTSKSVLSKLCELAEFNTGKVNLASATRQEICEQLQIRNNVLSMSLKELCEKKLISGEKGSYIINAQIFWKGDLRSRNVFLGSKEFEIQFTVPCTALNVQEIE